MTQTHTTDTRDPADIEREIRRTQRDMSRTADRIGEQLTPRSIFDALLDKAGESGIDARFLLDQARRNPIALGMIAIGGLWLVSDSDARAKTFTDKFGGDAAPGDEWDQAHHQGYVTYMAAIEPRADEDHEAYRRRRDCARATYLMVEQRHDEDETSWRKRLDEATDALRDRRDRVAQKARDFGNRTRRGAGKMTDKVERAYQDNPLIGGLAAAFVGAMAGAAIPASRFEEEQLGEYGADAIDAARDKAMAKKDELVDEADRTIAASGQTGAPSAAREKRFETA
ncbi:DUF3618 domain-containing protein [Tsuneonella sp. SYSU-LHT278]|uniref:DUF3618 domain-containing protein n=1 Tax=Tsuneonella sediminis TaxID=3416089 RepID=UPI003F7A0FFC